MCSRRKSKSRMILINQRKITLKILKSNKKMMIKKNLKMTKIKLNLMNNKI